MTFTNALTLISGLGLFLFGMKIMSDGLELAAGSRLRRMLEIITSKRIVGVMVGLVVTAIIQSSSATTVMVVGFVNAGLMSIAQSVGVIMGANVGTTATSWLVALNPKQIAPFALIAGVIMVSFFRKKTINHVGLIFTGLGMLFLGLDLMSSGLHPLREYQPFINMM
ncbi:MAG: Na/Pi symporter, partial [Oscillospiraceae bacterium]|nr:Na/Pi symporter [Oscillospiraceae bacterium]